MANIEKIHKFIYLKDNISIELEDGEKNNLQAGLEHLRSLGVQFEELGYVPNDVIPFA